MQHNSSIEVFTTCPLSNDLSSDQIPRSFDRGGQVERRGRMQRHAGLLGQCPAGPVVDFAPDHPAHEEAVPARGGSADLHASVLDREDKSRPSAISTDAAFYLNMVAGGFKNDLEALNDSTPHDQRYDRLTEYTTIIMQLLSSASPVTYEGEFYRVSKLKLAPPLAAGAPAGRLRLRIV